MEWRELIFALVLSKCVSESSVRPAAQNSSEVVRIRAWHFFKGSSFEPIPCNVNAEACAVEFMILFLLLLFEEVQAIPS